MNRSLRQYQTYSNNGARSAASKGFRCILIQEPTGTGKTRQTSEMISRSISKFVKNGTLKREQLQTVWFVIPRNEVLWQASIELSAWGINHGKITAKSKESPAFQVHLCSRETLRRRILAGKIRRWADVIFIDEAHLALDQQIFIKNNAPEHTLFLGLTATPQLLSGRGLTDMWDTWVPGHQLIWFVENGGFREIKGEKVWKSYLKRPLVYGLPQERRVEIEKPVFTDTGDLNRNSQKQLDELHKARSKGGFIFGDSIEHYWSLSNGRSFLDFNSSIMNAELKAEEWRKKGFKVESIDGKMSDKKRRGLIDAVKTGELLGLTAVDLPTYGLDVPRISCVIFQRRTQSLALFYQMLGRALRADDEYDDAHIHDNVGNCDKIIKGGHGHPLIEREWNFSGNIKKDKIPKDAIEKIGAVKRCSVCWGKIINGFCEYCGLAGEIKSRKPLKQVGGYLVEIQPDEPVKLKDRTGDDQANYQDLINFNKDKFRLSWYGDGGENEGGVIDEEAIKNLVEAFKKIRRQPMSIYYELRKNGDKAVNVSLLFAIQKASGYKNGWAYFKRKELERSA